MLSFLRPYPSFDTSHNGYAIFSEWLNLPASMGGNVSSSPGKEFVCFWRIHKTLRVSPAMEVKVTDRLWDIEDIIDLID